MVGFVQEIYPLSPMQSGLLFHALYAPKSEAYFVQNIFEFGAIDSKALRLAWQKVSDHHAVLRTGFMWEEISEPLQYVLESVPVPFIEYNWENLTEDEQKERFKEIIVEDRKKGFDLSQAPVFRLQLIKCREDKYYFIWSQHHILFDGWCLPIILRDVFHSYEAIKTGKIIKLQDSRAYKDYIAWLQKQDLSQAEGFWKKCLSNIENPTLLSFKGIIEKNEEEHSNYYLEFSVVETEALKEFAKQHNLTVNTVIQGAVGVVLQRYTQQEDIVFGMTVSGRSIDIDGIEDMVGIFINTLPLRIRLDKSQDQNIASYLRELQNQTQQLNEYAHTSLAQIQSWSGMSELFNILFVFENYPITEGFNIAIDNLKIYETRVIEKTEYPLTIIVTPGKNLNIELKYQTEHFDHEIIQKLSFHFKMIIKEVVANPNQAISNLSILTEAEKQQQLVHWNDTVSEYPKDQCIYTIFEEQVKKTPDAIALVYEDQQITYEELNKRSNQLAHYLRKQGVGRETLVAISVERSLEMVIGLLGILKAGGAYIPLDPSYPKDRLQFMLEDTKAPILLTQVSLKERFKDYNDKIITLDKDWKKIEKESISNLIPIATANDIAYVIYTSGSTGRPKGVMVGHQGLCNRLSWMQDQYKLRSIDNVLQKTPYSFDVSVWELFWPLMFGSKEILTNQSEYKDTEYLLNLINKEQVTVLHFVPTMLDSFLTVEELKKKGLSIKLVITSGEALSNNSKVEFYSKLSGELHNLYGPTEASIDVSYYYCDPVSDKVTVPIGRPISNMQMYIVDKEYNPLPIGVVGELYIGGIGVARGYLNRADLTSERFIANPFATEEDVKEGNNLRLYRTGDLSRYLPDGNIEYMGRIDDQVKIRGFRIELGEIESTLVAHASVLQAVVVARVEEGDKKLVAYVLPSIEVQDRLSITEKYESFSVLGGEGASELIEEIRNDMQRSLPDYMIPSFFVFIDKIPLTPNGKIDRKALPMPDSSLRVIEDEYVAPRNSIEEGLCEIWEEVLKVKSIGVNDNFFKLGGHSLLATQVISRIRNNYKIDIPLKALFEQPTISKLGKVVTGLVKGGGELLVPPITAMARTEEIPLSFAQTRLWFLDQLLPNVALYNIAVALRLKGKLKVKALEQALNAIIERHESLRTIFKTTEGTASQIIISELKINLIAIETQEESVKKYVEEEANTGFALSQDPLIRAKLLKLNHKDDHVLLITLHHIISDGWSLGILFNELSTLYNGYVKGEDIKLPALEIQYADFSLWQRGWLQGEALDKQLSYWQEQLAGIPEIIELPTDRVRPKELSYKGGIYNYNLSKEVRDKLVVLSQEHQASLFMVLLGAYQVLLHKYSGQDDIVVGAPIANRNYKEIEGLIGFFVNTLALRTIFKDKESFVDVLKRVQETTLEAYKHQDVPFEQLVDHLNVARALNHNPVFQVMFDLQNAVDGGKLTFNDIKVSGVESSYSVAKFDLTLSAYEHEDGIGLTFGYMEDLYDSLTIERMAKHFEMIVNEVIANPYQSISNLSILTEAEKQQQLVHWNDTVSDYPKDKSIHTIFEEQVKETPDAIALVYEDQQVTYEELNKRSNQLAHYLRKQGVGRETLVAISVERSLEMVIGLLGILKAGGAYIPLDPSYPKDRLQFMLEDTKAPILLTQVSLKERFKDYNDKIITLDGDWKKVEKESVSNLIPIATANDIAYVIYTSGSTGRPKGVMVGHQGLCNRLSWMQDQYKLRSIDNVLQKTPYSFDVSVWELFWPLMFGSKEILTNQSEYKDTEYLLNLINKEQVTVLHFVPTMLDSFLTVEELKKKGLSIKLVITSGEALSNNSKVEFYSKLSGELHNLYGPTEASIDVSYYYCDPVSDKVTVPIGRPISNMQMYIVDKEYNPLPIGVVGELYIGGVGLARGYLNRADLTSERFIANPFATEEDVKEGNNLRLYRTGDLSRYLPDGNIEYMGRIDDQVKIRGYRIELGEIESTLVAHASVLQAVVVARVEEGDKKLVAYVLPSIEVQDRLSITEKYESFSVLGGEGASELIEEIRNDMQRSLPDYMIPSFFVFIDKIPLTPNGKIDRKALPTPDSSLRIIEDEYVSPRNSIEQNLKEVWQEILKVKDIGVNDNFFRIGGDSIISIQMVAKARQKGIQFSVKDIFNYPTISALATVANSNVHSVQVKATQGLVIGAVPLIPIQHSFFEQSFANNNHFNQAVLLKPNQEIDLNLLKEAFRALLSHHDVLRMRYNKKQQHWEQECLAEEENVICNAIDLSDVNDEQVRTRIEDIVNKTQASLNIKTGPLIKAVLINCGNTKPQRLFIVIHHLCVDGVSWRVLLEDLETVYKQLSNKETISLPPKTHSYQQWSLALREYAKSEQLKKEKAYWQEVEQSIRLLTTDFDHGEANGATLSAISASLTQEETSKLLHQVPKAYRTQINDVLLTALVLALGDWTGVYDTTINLEGHGREEIVDGIDLSRTVGWFTSIFPVHLKINAPNNLGEALKTIKESLRQIPNKGIGYGILKYLSKEIVSNQYPALCFNYLGQWGTDQEDNLFSTAPEGIGRCISEKNKHFHLIDINSEVREGKLVIWWNYSNNHYNEKTIEELSKTYANRLRELINHCCQDNVFGYTASDFSSVELDQVMIIDKLVNM